ncbi:hypothetical protein AGMMS50239_15760 [Bacteroidia bacterium]|nr:hypothetical protein AGMMS50239_15760 [Bacteroidia bacterium]
MKNLPIGIQSFKKLREENRLYVDKTKYILQLVTTGSVYFLSRPRRFGKSLLVSTMTALFQGKKSLFEGLDIYDKWDWTQTNPVIRLDFAGINNDTAANLQADLEKVILKTAQEYGISLTREAAGSFFELISKLHQTTGRQVVVLIDEYDKPIIDHLTDLSVAEENRNVLKSFYGILKPADEHLRFVLLTGVSKFNKVSIFSELNNLNDITMDDRYASICGYTQTELETCFDEYIERLQEEYQMEKTDVLNTIRKWYDGYSWDGSTSVYNPFSTLLLFDKKIVSNYWFETGTPTFLINLIKEKNGIQFVLDSIMVEDAAFIGYDIRQIDIVPILFQTGYLTVKSKQTPAMAPPEYILGVPNKEVHDSLMRFLVSGYANFPVSQTDNLNSSKNNVRINI